MASAAPLARRLLVRAGRDERLRHLAQDPRAARALVGRFLAGEEPEDAVSEAGRLRDRGMQTTLSYLGEEAADPAAAEEMAEVCTTALGRVAAAGLGPATRVSLKLSGLGLGLAGGEGLATRHARRVCAAARNAGSAVTLDMEDHRFTDATLRVHELLRADYPDTGVAVQTMLRRAERDCRDLARRGARVRLVKGAYTEPADLAWASAEEVDLSYVRCLRVLLGDGAYPMVATHDPRLVRIAQAMAVREGLDPVDWEIQMLRGVRPREQERLAHEGYQVRVYVPFGRDWYPYLLRRVAERPRTLGLLARSMLTRG